MKPFEEVEVGNIAQDYSGNIWKVVDKGTAKEMTEKYYTSWGVADCEDDFDPETPCIVEKCYEPSPLEGFTHNVFIYGYDGATVGNLK